MLGMQTCLGLSTEVETEADTKSLEAEVTSIFESGMSFE